MNNPNDPKETIADDRFYKLPDLDGEEPDIAITEPAYPKLCPHGNEWHLCNACMELGDFMYDCNREG